MRCAEARAEHLGGTPSDEATRHMDSCPRCRSVRPQLEAMRSGLADPLLWVEPPPELEHAVIDLIARRDEPAAGSGRRWGVATAAAVVVFAIAGTAAWAALRPPAPDWEVTMEGVAPGTPAGATVAGWRTATGTRLVVTADGLDEAPVGHAYELWFSRDGIHVSAGTFTSLDDPVELTVGVRRGDYPRLWMTLEPIDGEPYPSGVVLFDVGD